MGDSLITIIAIFLANLDHTTFNKDFLFRQQSHL